MGQEVSISCPSLATPLTHLSHVHILRLGLTLKSLCPTEWVIFIRTQTLHSRAALPAPTHIDPHSTTSQIYTPKLLSVSIGQLLAMHCSLCPLLLTANSKKNCVSRFLKQRHLNAILKILVRVLIYCFYQLSLTCGQNPQRSSKEKDSLGKLAIPIGTPCL